MAHVLTLDDYRKMPDLALSLAVYMTKQMSNRAPEARQSFEDAMQAALERMPDYPDAVEKWIAGRETPPRLSNNAQEAD